jgi:transcriptional regulator with XRE-family HTH domain
MSTENDQPITLMSVRQKAKMTQKQWAEWLGVTISTVSNWERGVQVPRLTFLQTKKIMDATGLSIDSLVAAFDNTYEKEQSARDDDNIPGALPPIGGA